MKKFLTLCLFVLMFLAACNPFSDSDEDSPESKSSSSNLSSSSVYVEYFTLNLPDTLITKTATIFSGTASSPITLVNIQIDNYSIGNAQVVNNQYTMNYSITNAGSSRIVTALAFGANNQVLDTLYDTLVVLDNPVKTLVIPPYDSACIDTITQAGVAFTKSPAQKGISTPVILQLPILGIDFRYVESTTTRKTMLMDCALANALAKAVPIMKELKIKQVLDLGVYNFRCIGSEGTPPDCKRGISEHAYAKAFDIGGVLLEDSTQYLITKDWVVNDSIPTCDTIVTTPADSLFHTLVCEMHAQKIWGNTLTPNYNKDHWNHIHLDLKPGDYFLKKTGNDYHYPNVDEGEDWH